MSIAKLVLPAQIRRRHDPDAAAYIASVETADGQSLEQGIKDAITGFVVDCKITGIWNAIQSCCLLCGARTLNGALVPLKGPAPTNFNSLFTNNDYNRETGLKGNGSSKFLNTNFTASSLPQDNFHFSFHISSLSSVGAQRTYMADGGTNMYRPISNNTLTQFNINASFGSALGDLDMATSTGFCGLSRDNASNFTIRIGSRNRVVSASSVGGNSGTMRIFGRNGNNVMGEFSDGRIAFYSIGEQVNLKSLNDCVDSLLRKIKQIFYPSLIHPDITNWIQRYNQLAPSASSYSDLSSSTLHALNAFCNSIHSNNLRSKIYRLNLFMGPNLLSARIPFYLGPDDNTFYGSRLETFFNFSESLYNTEIGLIGNGTSSYIESGLPTSLLMDIFPSTHLSYYCTNVPANNNSFIKTILSTQQGWALGSNGALTNRIGRNSILLASSVGSRILSRTSESSLCLYDDGILASCNNATTTVPNYNFAGIRIFASRINNNLPAEFNNGSYGGYSIGLGLDETEASNFANIMKTFQQSIGRI